MRVLVTGARGKVGRATVEALYEAGHQVTATDRRERGATGDGESRYMRAELTDAGAAFTAMRDCDAVVHAAAIPDPLSDPPQVVFHNNLTATFNTLEAAVRSGVRRFVYVSTIAVMGWFFGEREVTPEYLPVDELHPVKGHDPYALSKYFGEQLMSAAVARSDISCISLRIGWVQTPETYARELGAQMHADGAPDPAQWTYVDVRDVADAIRLAVEADLAGHEVINVAAADNPGGRDFAAAVKARYGDSVALRRLERADSSAIATAKARELLGWEARRSWRDHLDEHGRARLPA